MGLYTIIWLFFDIHEMISYSSRAIDLLPAIMFTVLMFLSWRRPLEGGIVLVILGVVMSLYYGIATMLRTGYFQVISLLVGMPYLMFGLLFLINKIRWLSENYRYSALVTVGLSLCVLVYISYILYPWVECGLEGGQYVRRGLGQFYACQHAYSDANKKCSNSKDCQGACMVPYEAVYETSVPEFGQCAENDDPYGCKCYLDYPDIQCSCLD
jgi:hypothetical protein